MASTYFQRRIVLDEIAQRSNTASKKAARSVEILASLMQPDIELPADLKLLVAFIESDEALSNDERTAYLIAIETTHRLKLKAAAQQLADEAKGDLASAETQYAAFLSDVATQAEKSPDDKALQVHAADAALLAGELSQVKAEAAAQQSEVARHKVPAGKD